MINEVSQKRQFMAFQFDETTPVAGLKEKQINQKFNLPA